MRISGRPRCLRIDQRRTLTGTRASRCGIENTEIGQRSRTGFGFINRDNQVFGIGIRKRCIERNFEPTRCRVQGYRAGKNFGQIRERKKASRYGCRSGGSHINSPGIAVSRITGISCVLIKSNLRDAARLTYLRSGVQLLRVAVCRSRRNRIRTAGTRVGTYRNYGLSRQRGNSQYCTGK